MAATVDNSASNYLGESGVNQMSTGTIAGWYKPSSLPATGERYYIARYAETPTSGTEDKIILMLPDGTIKGYIFDGAVKLTAASGNAASSGAWSHIAMSINGTTLAAYVDSGTPGTVAAGNSFTGYATPEFFLGLKASSAKDSESTVTSAPGDYAGWALWNAGLTADEIAALAAGAHPFLIRPNALIRYWPVYGAANEIDHVNKRTLAHVGTVTQSEHKSIIHPSSIIVTRAGAAAATAAITGTATASITESDVVTGGKTIIITLTGDTFKAAGTGPIGTTAQSEALLAGIDSAQSEATGWDAEVKANLTTSNLTRDSDTQATITLPASASYDITAQETITVTVPTDVLVTGAAPIVGSPTFTVDTVSAGVALSIFGQQGVFGGVVLR